MPPLVRYLALTRFDLEVLLSNLRMAAPYKPLRLRPCCGETCIFTFAQVRSLGE